MAGKKKGTGNTAVVYARYSSHAQTEQSIEGQIKAADAYAKEKGYQIIEYYIDRAISGRTDNRPAFQKMLHDSAGGAFDVVVTWKIDRIGRNREDVALNRHLLRQNGVRIEYVAEALPEGNESVILEALLEGMAEYYSLQLATNVKRGMRLYASQAKHTGGTIPYGYRVAADRSYEVDPVTGPIVRDIFDKCLAGVSTDDITAYLGRKQAKNSCDRPFTRTNVIWILHNDKYMGVYRYGDIVIEGGMPAIVTEEEWEKVQNIMKRNRKRPSEALNYSDYLLSGRLVCGLCGSQLQGESCRNHQGKTYYYYTCGSRKNHGDQPACSLKRIVAASLDSAVVEALVELLGRDDLLGVLTEKIYEAYTADKTEDAERQAVEQQLADVTARIANLMKVVEQGRAVDTILSRIDELEKEKQNLEVEMKKYHALDKMRLTPDMIRFFLEKMREKAAILDEDTRADLIRAFVHHVEVYPDMIHICCNYQEDDRTAACRTKKRTPILLDEGSPGSSLVVRTGKDSNLYICFESAYFVLIRKRAA